VIKTFCLLLAIPVMQLIAIAPSMPRAARSTPGAAIPLYTALVYRVGRAIATETRAHGVDMLLAPVLCLPRDPRWGRTEETYGEFKLMVGSSSIDIRLTDSLFVKP
jgi:beta-glucosidase-like glycosyl hydrolase